MARSSRNPVGRVADATTGAPVALGRKSALTHAKHPTMPGTLCAPANDNLYATAATQISCSRCIKLLAKNEGPGRLVKRHFEPTARYPEEDARYQGDQPYRELHEMVIGGREGKYGRRLNPGDATRTTASAAWTRALESDKTYPEARTQPQKTVEEGGSERVATTNELREQAAEEAFSRWVAGGQQGPPPKAWSRRRPARIRRTVRINPAPCYEDDMLHLRKNPVHFLSASEADTLAEAEGISVAKLLSPTGPYAGRLQVRGASKNPAAKRASSATRRSGGRKPSTARGRGYGTVQQKGIVQVGPDKYQSDPWVITYNGYALMREGGNMAYALSRAKAMDIVKKLRRQGAGPAEMEALVEHQMSHNPLRKLFRRGR